MGGRRRGYGKCADCPKYSDACDRVNAQRNCTQNYHGVNETLCWCWCCANAVPRVDRETGHEYGCEWSLYFQPVPGWTAEKRVIPMEGKSLLSYNVCDCPKFERG